MGKNVFLKKAFLKPMAIRTENKGVWIIYESGFFK